MVWKQGGECEEADASRVFDRVARGPIWSWNGVMERRGEVTEFEVMDGVGMRREIVCGPTAQCKKSTRKQRSVAEL